VEPIELDSTEVELELALLDPELEALLVELDPLLVPVPLPVPPSPPEPGVELQAVHTSATASVIPAVRVFTMAVLPGQPTTQRSRH